MDETSSIGTANRLPLRRLTDEERKQRAMARINAFHTRPSTLAAKDFFQKSTATKDNNSGERRKKQRRNLWKSLPGRVRKLCETLQEWVRQKKYFAKSFFSLSLSLDLFFFFVLII